MWVLKEMTERHLLSPSDQKAQLGLDLSLEHHKNLQQEFAGEIAQLRATLGGAGAGGGASAGAAGAGSGGAGRVAVSPPPATVAAPRVVPEPVAVDTAELTRLRAEVAQWRERAERAQAESAESHKELESMFGAFHAELAAKDAGLVRLNRTVMEKTADATRLERTLAETTEEITHLTKVVAGMESRLSHLHLPAEAAPISSREAQAALMRIWQVNYPSEGSVSGTLLSDIPPP